MERKLTLSKRGAGLIWCRSTFLLVDIALQKAGFIFIGFGSLLKFFFPILEGTLRKLPLRR
jgi:hypothetical protein